MSRAATIRDDEASALIRDHAEEFGIILEPRTCADCLHFWQQGKLDEGGLCRWDSPLEVEGFVSGELRWRDDPACDHPMYAAHNYTKVVAA